MTPAWFGWLMLGCVLLAVVLVLVWPKGADPQPHPGFGDLTDEATAIREERDLMRAELKRLAQGEEPVTDPAVIPTPGQWIWKWNRATPERRLEVATSIMLNAGTADDCFLANHQARLEQLQQERNELHAAVERTREHLQRYRFSGGQMVNIRQVLGLLSPTWPDGNYVFDPAVPAEPLTRGHDGSQPGVDTQHEAAPERPAAPGTDANPSGTEGER